MRSHEQGKPTTLSRARGIAKRARSPEGVIADKEDVAQTMQISNGPAKRAKTDLSIIAVSGQAWARDSSLSLMTYPARLGAPHQNNNNRQEWRREECDIY